MQSIDIDRGIWAVVYTPDVGALIGRLNFPFDILNEQDEAPATPEQASGAVQAVILEGTAVLVDPCFGFKLDIVPMNTPHGFGTTMLRQAYPLANMNGPGRIYTRISGAMLFCEMKDEDRLRHKGVVEQLLSQLMAARAQQAGIKLAGPGDVPNGRVS